MPPFADGSPPSTGTTEAAMAAATTTDELYVEVAELTALGRDAAVERVLPLVGEYRVQLEEVRNRFAGRLHGHSDDFQATAALAILNRALATVVPTDRLDWKERWARGRKP